MLLLLKAIAKIEHYIIYEQYHFFISVYKLLVYT